MPHVLIIYGTTGGNTELVVEQVVHLLGKAGVKADMKKVEKFKVDDLIADMKRAQVIVLASPTYGHGQLQEHMIPLLEKMRGLDLKDKPYAVIGLGDPKYDSHYHIESTAILEEALSKCGAKKIHYALRISRSPLLQMDNLIPKWTDKFIEALRLLT